MNFQVSKTLLVAAFSGMSFYASELFANPTIWKVINQAKFPVKVSCESSELAGLKTRAHFESPVIAPSSTYTHNWGDAWHNDGMGLNAGTFTCRIDRPLDSAGVRIVTFRTDWDESVEISVSDLKGKISLSKMQSKPRGKVARSDR